MKNCFLIFIFFCAGERLPAQPWKIKEEFKSAFMSTEDTNLVYRKTNKGNSCFVETYTKDDPDKKMFDYVINRSDGKKNGMFNLYDGRGRWYCSMSFRDGLLEEVLIKLLDSSLARYRISNNLFNGVHSAYYPNGNIKEYGFYKDNARVGDWIFYYRNGKVKATGAYWGNYTKLLYDYNAGNLISINQYLDTVNVEKMTKSKFDSLKLILHLDFVPYPLHLNYETGVWKCYDETGRLVKEEFYNKGNLEKTEIK